MPPDSPNGQNVTTAIGRGEVTGSSFSFSVNKKGQSWTRQADGTYVREMVSADNLFDVGPVVFPAYDASTAGLRSIGEPENFDEFKRALEVQAYPTAAQRAAELRRFELADLRR